MRFYGGYHPVADYLGPEGAASPMDSEFYDSTLGETMGTGVKDIGMSVPMGISASNVSGIYSKIRMGAGNIEIGFPGLYQGNRQGHTPGMYGEDQRQAIREIAKVNEVK